VTGGLVGAVTVGLVAAGADEPEDGALVGGGVVVAVVWLAGVALWPGNALATYRPKAATAATTPTAAPLVSERTRRSESSRRPRAARLLTDWFSCPVGAMPSRYETKLTIS
jgi:hypothetical protein